MGWMNGWMCDQNILWKLMYALANKALNIKQFAFHAFASLQYSNNFFFVPNEPDIFYLIFQINDFEFSEIQLLHCKMEFKLFCLNTKTSILIVIIVWSSVSRLEAVQLFPSKIQLLLYSKSAPTIGLMTCIHTFVSLSVFSIIFFSSCSPRFILFVFRKIKSE